MVSFVTSIPLLLMEWWCSGGAGREIQTPVRDLVHVGFGEFYTVSIGRNHVYNAFKTYCTRGYVLLNYRLRVQRKRVLKVRNIDE